MESPWENQVTLKQLLQMLREKGEKGKGGRAVGGKGEEGCLTFYINMCNHNIYDVPHTFSKRR